MSTGRKLKRRTRWIDLSNPVCLKKQVNRPTEGIAIWIRMYVTKSLKSWAFAPPLSPPNHTNLSQLKEMQLLIRSSSLLTRWTFFSSKHFSKVGSRIDCWWLSHSIQGSMMRAELLLQSWLDRNWLETPLRIILAASYSFTSHSAVPGLFDICRQKCTLFRKMCKFSISTHSKNLIWQDL